MRTLLIAGALGALVLAMVGCGGSGVSSADKTAERRVNLYEISQIELVLPRSDIQEEDRPDGESVRTECDRHIRPGEDGGGKETNPAGLVEIESIQP